jgi:hypothetical protein
MYHTNADMTAEAAQLCTQNTSIFQWQYQPIYLELKPKAVPLHATKALGGRGV